jgi:hypothetical protein
MPMNKFALSFILLTILVIVAMSTASFGAVSVGVKKGDWIEYQVTTTGNPPAEHDAIWGRMEVKDIDDSTIYLNVTTQFKDKSFLVENVTLDVAAGTLGDDFIIPANLALGDAFYDLHIGNITIDKAEQRTYAGTERSVVSGSTPQTTFYWDKATGILVEAHSSYPNYNFTMDTIADKTNMWNSQIMGFEPSIFYASIAAIAAVIVIVAAIVVLRRKKTP